MKNHAGSRKKRGKLSTRGDASENGFPTDAAAISMVRAADT